MQHNIKAVVTGHSRGLGAAITEQLLEHGIPVLACARKRHSSFTDRFPSLLSEHLQDLSDTTALAAWLEDDEISKFCKEAKTLLLINNAGTLGPVGAIETQSLREIAAAVSINVTAPLMITSALARHHQGELRVIHISSGAARSAYPGWSIYCATKAALDHHARAIAADGRRNLRICSLAPGVVDTDMQTEIRSTPEERFPLLKKFQKMKQDGTLTSPQEAAMRLVSFLLSDEFGNASTADIRELTISTKK